MNYEIKITEHKHPVPYVVFEDETYDLLGEFLLAERSFRREILSLTNEVDLGSSESESFTGNAFSLEINKENCKITNDSDDRELTVATKDFKAVLLDYIYKLREIKVKEKMASHKHREKPADPYAQEVKERWGDTDAFRESEERVTDLTQSIPLLDAVIAGFAELSRDGVSPDSEPAKHQVKQLQQCITENFYTCTDEILAGLGQMYVADERFQKNIDRHGEGTAQYISECIKAYCRTSE